MSSKPEKKKAYVPSTYVPIAQQKEMKLARIKALKLKKKLRAQQEIQRQKQAQIDAELSRAQDLASQRWKDCLSCLSLSVPKLKSNPWLIILEPVFIHDYLDSLTETLANLSKHESDIDTVRRILQDVYEAFVDVGRFAKYQPAFYITHPATIKRFVRLLEQVAHRGSDKALFPNVLSLLGPTFEREELYDLLADARIVHSLMSFVRTDWMPTPATLSLLLAIIEQLSSSSRMRQLFQEDPGFEKLQGLSAGLIEGFTKDQQNQAQQALALYPPPRMQMPVQIQPTAGGTGTATAIGGGGGGSATTGSASSVFPKEEKENSGSSSSGITVTGDGGSSTTVDQKESEAGGNGSGSGNGSVIESHDDGEVASPD